MDKFEYRVHEIGKSRAKKLLVSLPDELNGMGEMGWELDKIVFDPFNPDYVLEKCNES